SNPGGPYGASYGASGAAATNAGYDPQVYPAGGYGQQYGQQPVGQSDAAVPPVGGEEGATRTSKSTRTVGPGAALAMMLVAGIGAGVLAGYIVSSNSSTNNGTSDSEILNSHPLNDPSRPRQEAEAATTEAVAAKVLPAVDSIQVVSSSSASEGSG